MTIDRTSFFSHIRDSLFRGALDQGQVDGLTAILDGWEQRLPNGDVRQLAYTLATPYHECARTMQPIREVGLGRGRPYGYAEPPYGHVYYGRGFVQLTWETNYEKAGKLVEQDLVQFPDKALELPIATSILITGLQTGLFTGAALSRYINAQKCDFYDARRTVNGVDCATEIAQYANAFLQALTAGTPQS